MAARHNEKYVDAAVNSATVEIDRALWADDAHVTIGIEQSLDGGKTWAAVASGATTAGKRSKASLKVFLPNDDVMGRLVRGFTRVEKGEAPDAPSLVTEIARRPAKVSGHHSVGYDADGSASAVASGLTTLTLSSFTIASNSDRALLAFVGTADAASITVSSVVWNTSENLTQFQANAGTLTRARGWSLVAPTATTADLVATISADADMFVLFAASFYNVDQSTPLGTSQVSNLTGTRAEISCAGDTDGMSVGFAMGSIASNGLTITSRTDVPFYVGIGAGTQSNGATTLSPAAPSDRLLGDLEILTVATENNATITVDAAWTRIGTVVQQDSTWQQDLFYRVYDGSDVQPAPSWAGSVGCSAKRILFRNASVTSPIGNTNTNSGTGSTHSITGINASANNSRVGYLSHAEANTALGNDADYTERNDAGSATGPYRIVVGERTQATSGAGAANFSATGANASWVMRLWEMLAGTAQTPREEIEADQAGNSHAASLVTEDGALYNTLCWEFSGTTVAGAQIAVSVKPAAIVTTTDKILTVTLTATESILRTVTKRVSVTTTATASIRKTVSKIVSGASTATASIRKSVAKIMTAATTSTAFLSFSSVFSRAMAVGVSCVASMQRSVAKIVQATVTGTATFQREIAKGVAVSVTGSPGIFKTVGKIVSATSSATAETYWTVSKILSGNVTGDPSIGRGLSLNVVLSVAITATATILPALVKLLSASISATASMVREISKLLSVRVPYVSDRIRWAATLLEAIRGDKPNWNQCARCDRKVRPNKLIRQMEYAGPRLIWTGLRVCSSCLDEPHPSNRWAGYVEQAGDPRPVPNPRPRRD